ncbi:MAG: PIN domain-containing protein [Candidatus Mariimomonas ferrooxydans]
MDFISSTSYSNRFTTSLCVMELIQGCLNKEEIKIVKKFVKENFSSVIHPDEKISEKAMRLLEQYALSDGLRTVDALIAASALIAGASLATVNFKHFKSISKLHILKFKP